MQPFTVIVPLHRAARMHVEIAVQSFARFYFNVTSRHRPFLKLALIDKGDWLMDISKLGEANQILEACQYVFWQEVAMPQSLLTGGSVMFLPIFGNNSEWIEEALVNGLPVIGYEDEAEKTMLDNSCAMLLANRSEEDDEEAFGKLLEMLYFDPGALKMLRRGARRRHHNVLPLNEGTFFSKVA